MRIVVTGGGTGGHIFPALEIAKEIKRQNEKIEVIFAGNKNSLEEKMARASHIPFFAISTKKIVGQGFVKKVIALFYLKLAILKSLWFLLNKRPMAIIGVGGYVSAPMIMASFLLGIKRFVCEQNVVPGVANKNLAKIAKKIFISFEDSRKFFPSEKTIYSGNPVRKEFFALTPNKKSEEFKILITGGSLGAHFLNQEVPRIMGDIHTKCPKLFITHQTGQAMREEVLKYYKQESIPAKVVTFIENMSLAFAEHDLLISRAGATVCAEIMASGMPAVLVPYPFANGHQRYNALALANFGAAIMIEENNDFNSHLALTIKTLYSEPCTLHQMAQKAKSMGAKKAAFIITSSILNDL